MVKDHQILLDCNFTVVEFLDAGCILHDLRLKIGLSAGISSLEHDNVPIIQDARVMDWHRSVFLYFINYIYILS